MQLFLLFFNAVVLFGGAFSLWVSLKLRLGLPYNRISVTYWSENSCKLLTISFNLSNEGARIGIQKWQSKKKCAVDSFSKLQIHFEFVQLWNLCLNLCWFKWLNPSFIRIGLWILNTQLGIGLNSWMKCFWKAV